MVEITLQNESTTISITSHADGFSTTHKSICIEKDFAEGLELIQKLRGETYQVDMVGRVDKMIFVFDYSHWTAIVE